MFRAYLRFSISCFVIFMNCSNLPSDVIIFSSDIYLATCTYAFLTVSKSVASFCVSTGDVMKILSGLIVISGNITGNASILSLNIVRRSMLTARAVRCFSS